MVELDYPGCERHSNNRKCPVHGGEWAHWQCEVAHTDDDDVLYTEIALAWRQSIQLGIEAATQIALYGSAFIQVDRQPGIPPKVTVLNTPDVTIRKS